MAHFYQRKDMQTQANCKPMPHYNTRQILELKVIFKYLEKKAMNRRFNKCRFI